MNKPEKKEHMSCGNTNMALGFEKGYNQACDDWEEYYEAQCDLCALYDHDKLPSEEEIYEELCIECGNKERGDLLNSADKEKELWRYVKAISKRIRGEE